MRLQDLGLPFAVSANGTASMVVPTNHKLYKQITKLDDYTLTASSGSPDTPVMTFTPKKRVKDKFVLFWVYGDDDDTPYIIRNPPRNLGKLLTEWNALDAKMTSDPEGTGDIPEGWDYVNKWLKSRGVDIFPASKEVRLDDYQGGDSDEA